MTLVGGRGAPYSPRSSRGSGGLVRGRWSLRGSSPHRVPSRPSPTRPLLATRGPLPLPLPLRVPTAKSIQKVSPYSPDPPNNRLRLETDRQNRLSEQTAGDPREQPAQRFRLSLPPFVAEPSARFAEPSDEPGQRGHWPLPTTSLNPQTGPALNPQTDSTGLVTPRLPVSLNPQRHPPNGSRGRQTFALARPSLDYRRHDPPARASSHFHRASRFDPRRAFLPACHTLHPPFEVNHVP